MSLFFLSFCFKLFFKTTSSKDTALVLVVIHSLYRPSYSDWAGFSTPVYQSENITMSNDYFLYYNSILTVECVLIRLAGSWTHQLEVARHLVPVGLPSAAVGSR